MRRKLFTLCSAASLLLCVAVCVMALRSRTRTDGCGVYLRAHVLSAMSEDGVLELAVNNVPSNEPSFYRFSLPFLAPLASPPPTSQSIPYDDTLGTFWDQWQVGQHWELLGLSVEQRRLYNAIAKPNDPALLQYALGIHYAWWCAATLVLPLVALRRALRRRHRGTAGLCPACGYDVRATPERCPEYGKDREGMRTSNV
jgi:hypothetical protein